MDTSECEVQLLEEEMHEVEVVGEPWRSRSACAPDIQPVRLGLYDRRL